MSKRKIEEPDVAEPPPNQAGRSMRERKKIGPYIDDDPNLVAALAYAEQDHKDNTKDGDAARNAGFMPMDLRDFERSCCAVPDKLKQKSQASATSPVPGPSIKNANKSPAVSPQGLHLTVLPLPLPLSPLPCHPFPRTPPPSPLPSNPFPFTSSLSPPWSCGRPFVL